MKYVLCVAAVLLAGCDKPIAQWHARDMAPLSNVEGLRDCVYVQIETGGRFLSVVRCPHSDTGTEYRSGKTTFQSYVVTP